jgi:hypothetical protein
VSYDSVRGARGQTKPMRSFNQPDGVTYQHVL